MIEEARAADASFGDESAIPLEGLAAGVDHLEAVVVFVLSHASTYASWVRPNVAVSATSIAGALREAYLASAQASARLTAAGGHGEPQKSGFATLTVEDGARIAIVQRVRSFGVATLFERDAPLGLARAHAHKIARTLEHELPYEAPARPAQPAPAPSHASVTLMMPTYVAPAAQSHATPPAADAGRAHATSHEEPAPETSASPRPAALDAATDGAAQAAELDAGREHPDTVSPPTIAKPPSSTPGERIGLRRPTPPMPMRSAGEPGGTRPPPAPELSLAHAESPNGTQELDASPESKAIRLVSYVERTSIEPHISILRLALRSGLGVEQLRELKRVTPEQLLLLETAAEDMLGVDRGKLADRIRGAVSVFPLPARGAS